MAIIKALPATVFLALLHQASLAQVLMDFIISFVTGIATSLIVVLIAFTHLVYLALDLKVNPEIRPFLGYKTAQPVTGFMNLQQPVM